MDGQQSTLGLEPQSFTSLVFRLAGQPYGVPIAEIHQIVEMVAITPIAQLPPFMPGVINYHGSLIPLVDLRLRFQLPFQPYRLHTPILLSWYDAQLLGLVVDSVDDVLEIPADRYCTYEQIIPAALNALSEQPIPQVYWAGLVEWDGLVMPIVKPRQLLSTAEQQTLHDALAEADQPSAIADEQS